MSESPAQHARPLQEPVRRTAGRNLPAAIASGAALAAVFLLTLVWHDYAFLTLVWVLVVIALFELEVAFRSRGLHPATIIAAVAGLIAFYGAYAVGPAAQSVALVVLVVGAVAAAAAGSRHGGRATSDVGATCLMGVWVPLCASFLGLLLAREDGAWLVVAAVALAAANDIGAYAVGNRVGRHKLAPSVSPGKSWEGFAGGVGTVLLVAGVGVSQIDGIGIGMALAFGAVVAVAATVGDLAESLVKRDLGVKDLGRVMPGHGGIMDRVDGILFALPATHLLLLAFGV